MLQFGTAPALGIEAAAVDIVSDSVFVEGSHLGLVRTAGWAAYFDSVVRSYMPR